MLRLYRKIHPRTLLTVIRDYTYSVKDEKKYNGWTNRATWSAQLWLANDEYTYELMCSLNMTDASQFENFCHYIWDNETPDGISLDDVNWEEVAEAWRTPE